MKTKRPMREDKRKTKEYSKKISKSLYGKRGKFARRWKGDLAGYTAIHTWLVNNYGKAMGCENLDCLKLPASRFEWASISGRCLRDRSDYIQLCTRCHRKFDNGNLVIRTINGLLEREKIIETKCPKCNHLFEIKL